MNMSALVLDDFEGSFKGKSSWVMEPTGTIRHLPTDSAFSERDGIKVEGEAYTLCQDDIELDNDSSLGFGMCGTVRKGMIKATKQPIALKGIRIESREKKEQLLNEVRGLAVADKCPQLVTWFGGFICKSMVYIVLELMDLGSLKKLAEKCCSGVPAPHIACISKESLTGLAFLHEKKIVHRDIKPENILHNTQGEVKLTDFGISRELDATLGMAGTQIGTTVYMAPEMCFGADYNFAVDIWSYGLVLYELATGHHPFPSLLSFPELFDCIVKDPEPRLGEAHPDWLREFVERCLTRDATRRADASHLLSHPSMNEVESKNEFAVFLNSL